MPLDPVAACNDERGDDGSSRGARDGRPFSSVNDFLDTICVWGRLEEVSTSRGISWERRNLAAARLIREGFFLGPVSSPVGAVVIISGAFRVSAWDRWDVRYVRMLTSRNRRRLLSLLLGPKRELGIRGIAKP